MKPREFDELIRQKFDQSDFEYNPANWDRLEDQLGGRSKKKSIIMWWLMPVAGIAASVAMAMGVYPLMQHGEITAPVAVTDAPAGKGNAIQKEATVPAQNIVASAERIVHYHAAIAGKIKPAAKTAEPQVAKEEQFGINIDNAIVSVKQNRKANTNMLFAPTINSKKEEVAVVTKKKEVAKKETKEASKPVVTFKERIQKPQPKFSIILTGAYAKGNQNFGSSAGVAIRRKINDKVFFEGAVAFTNSNINQDMPKQEIISRTDYVNTQIPTNGSGTRAGKGLTTGEPGGRTTVTTSVLGELTSSNVSYDLSYLQVSPSLGIKLIKGVSIGVGPDFQQALSDKRPTADPNFQGTSYRTPLFDVGLMARSEVSISRTLKAGVSYRKGINNVIAPMGSFIDHDYMQFQVKCAVFNR
jgi:hypothetical protein